mmetsp:Transcript_11430/g.17327  ORF Transcript_11430/g.17327 Transcript_11430/m.17327 type:complete len:127 (-) Transcript_11430:31-411(-)
MNHRKLYLNTEIIAEITKNKDVFAGNHYLSIIIVTENPERCRMHARDRTPDPAQFSANHFPPLPYALDAKAVQYISADASISKRQDIPDVNIVCSFFHDTFAFIRQRCIRLRAVVLISCASIPRLQ